MEVAVRAQPTGKAAMLHKPFVLEVGDNVTANAFEKQTKRKTF